jgi:hypothetical protein
MNRNEYSADDRNQDEYTRHRLIFMIMKTYQPNWHTIFFFTRQCYRLSHIQDYRFYCFCSYILSKVDRIRMLMRRLDANNRIRLSLLHIYFYAQYLTIVFLI